MGVDAPEILLDLRPCEWMAGAMMCGHLVAELDDVLAEVGLDRRDPGASR